MANAVFPITVRSYATSALSIGYQQKSNVARQAAAA
jgi:hypothetical protein